jgi:hypothetical protein
MAASDRERVIAWVGEELGTVRMWRVTILSGIGLVLVIGLVVMLGAVYASGSATIDDLGVPLAILGLLVPILFGGVIYGALGIRALRTHPLLLAFQATPHTVSSMELTQNGGWRGVRFTVASGETYTLWAASPTWAPWVVEVLRR